MIYHKLVRIEKLETGRGYGPCFLCDKEEKIPRTTLRMILGSKEAAERLQRMYRENGLAVEINYRAHQPTEVEVIAAGCIRHSLCLGRLKEAIESHDNLMDLERIMQIISLR